MAWVAIFSPSFSLAYFDMMRPEPSASVITDRPGEGCFRWMRPVWVPVTST